MPATAAAVAARAVAVTESLEQGLILMVAGMTTVFVLLTLLVWLVGVVSKLSRWLSPAPMPAATATGAAPAEGELASVIGAAVQAHRDRPHR